MKIEEKAPEERPKKWPRIMRGVISKGLCVVTYQNGRNRFICLSNGIEGECDIRYFEDLPAGFTVTLTNE